MNRDVRDEKQSGEVKTKISYLAHWCVKCVNYHKLTLHVLKKHWIMKRLGNNKDIVILRPDEGSGTVILNRDDYIKKLFYVISETSLDPTLLRKE